MFHPIRKLAREIHRRSVWQVLGAYLAMSWLALKAVELLTDVIGLPPWTPQMALVLLAIGLPIMVATAVVQEGLPGLRIQDFEDPNLMKGLTPEQVHVVPKAHPLYRAGVLTWKNAILGGVMAGVLLVGSVIAYFAMWSLGIGPVGSLIAQGVIDEQDLVIVADFENRTDEPSLGTTATDAFEIDLSESWVVTVLDDATIAAALGRMGRGPQAALGAPLAREIAISEGIKAVVEGDVSRGQGGYVVAARIVEPSAGYALAQFRETAEDGGQLIAAIDRLSERLREKLGESLRSIRSFEPLDQVTTSSLEALRLYSQAKRALDSGDVLSSISLLDEAVALDGAFALAWRKLAVIYSSTGLDEARRREVVTLAYEHRDRLTESERALAEADYRRTVSEGR